MGLIDDLKGKAQGLIHGNEQAIKDGLTKAGDFVDTKTGGKYSGHVASGYGPWQLAEWRFQAH